jgi:hypothetical protein
MTTSGPRGKTLEAGRARNELTPPAAGTPGRSRTESALSQNTRKQEPPRDGLIGSAPLID